MQAYSSAHVSIIEAVARQESLQQVSWYAVTPANDQRAIIVLACALARGCLLIKVDDGDSSFYGAAFLMKPEEAAAHISIELSEHVVNNVFFMVCLSPIMQVM